MTVIFLDFDGVLTAKDWGLDYNEHKIYHLSAPCVKVLNEILLQCPAKIILTTSWRKFFDADQQNQIFLENGIKGKPSGQTPYFPGKNRGEEIKDWMKRRRPDHFVILDDNEILGFPDHFYRTNFRTGLVMADIPKILEILKK